MLGSNRQDQESPVGAEISRSLLTSLGRLAQGVETTAGVAAGKAVSGFHADVQRRARETPGWDAMADYIEVWANNGTLIIGVREQDMVSEAMALEYGDETKPPSPLLRTLGTEADQANSAFNHHMIEAGVASPWRFGR